MNKLILQDNKPTSENILKLIKLIKSIEHQNGLSDDEIIQKYTHSDCRCLVSMIQQIIPNTKSILFMAEEEFFHYFVCVPSQNIGSNQNLNAGNFSYFDINGMKTYEEAYAFVSTEFKGKNNIITLEANNIILKNDITENFLNLVDCKFQEQELTI